MLAPCEVSLTLASADDPELPRLLATLQNQPFDLGTDRPLRALAVGDQITRLTRITLCVHHIACDGWSLGLLVMDLLALLGLEGEELPLAPQTLLEVAHEQRGAAIWQTRTKATQRYFRASYQTPVTDFRDRDQQTGVLQAALESAALRTAAEHLADQHKVSLATVFTTAFLNAVAAQCHSGPIRIGLMTSNRFLDRWRNQVTTMNQVVPMIAALEPDDDFGAQLRSIQLSTMRAYRIGLFDVDLVTPAALGLPSTVDGTAPTCAFNIVNGAPVEYPDSARTPKLHWERAFNLAAAGCNLKASITTGDTVRLRLRTGGLSADVASTILLDTCQRVLAEAS